MGRPPAVLADAVRELTTSSARPVVLIDGGAGSGKTTLARQLADYWPTPGVVQVVGLDELYPGWGGLAEGSKAVPEVIRGVGFRTWDWQRNTPGDWRQLNPAQPLIVEGCGAITAPSRALAGLAVWLEVDESARRQRALARDGAQFASHWDDWAVQEAAHWLADKPWELADLTISAVV